MSGNYYESYEHKPDVELYNKKGRTATLEVVMDIRDIAYLSRLYDELEIDYSSRGRLLSIAFSDYIEITKRLHPGVEMPETIEQAKRFIEKKWGEGSATKGRRKIKPMIVALGKETLDADADSSDITREDLIRQLAEADFKLKRGFESALTEEGGDDTNIETSGNGTQS